MSVEENMSKAGNQNFSFMNSIRYSNENLVYLDMVKTSRELRELSKLLREDAQRIRGEVKRIAVS